MSATVLIKVEGVSKKFCRSLKRSLWYGVQDVAAELLGRSSSHFQLRKNEFWAVNDISFELRRGECMGLIGPNGAGKSTLLKMLNGLIKPDKGRIGMLGRVGALIELGAGFNPILTARENIYVNGSVLGFSKKEIDQVFDAIVDFAEIDEFIDTPVQNLSSGMKVRLGFSVAAQLKPDILLIDEILAVGDVRFRMKCFRHLLLLKEMGTSIILVSHNMVDINRTCDRVIVVNHGRAICDSDVAFGQAEYMKSCEPLVQKRGPIQHETTVHLAQGRILDESGEDTHELYTGQSASIELLIDCKEVQNKVRVWVAIQASSIGLITSFSSVEDRTPVNLSRGINKVQICLPDLQLRVGHYFISCGVYGANIDSVLDFRDCLCDFKITGPRLKSFGYGSGGILTLPHQWKTE